MMMMMMMMIIIMVVVTQYSQLTSDISRFKPSIWSGEELYILHALWLLNDLGWVLLLSYGSIEEATCACVCVCVCVCVCALHGYRAPRVIWSTSLRRSGLVGRRNWQLHTLLLLPQTSTLKTPQTFTSLTSTKLQSQPRSRHFVQMFLFRKSVDR